jgi:hypothetical protein
LHRRRDEFAARAASKGWGGSTRVVRSGGGQLMRTVVVRYETKPDRADENQRLVEKVFAELAERQPDNFSYVTFRLEDGVSFVHVIVEKGDGSNPTSLADIPAFTEFTRDIADRCVVQPVAQGAQIVGSHRFIPD